MASVIGLAPIWLPKPCKSVAPQTTFASRKAVARLERPAARAALHSRTTCVEPINWSPRLVSRQRLLVFSEALICLSYSGKWLAEPKLGERRLVVPAGNAPASSGYQPGALLLSYETSSSCGFTPKRRIGRKVTLGFAAGRMRIRRFGL